MTRRRFRPRGMTLIELMITLGVVLVGMVGLFKVLSTSVAGSSSAQRFIQAQARAQQVLEAIRTAPQTVDDCLRNNVATGWAQCETLCKNTLGPTAQPSACIFSSLNAATMQANDTTQQLYSIVVDGGDDTRSTWVRAAGASGRVYDAEISIGWNDDGTAPVGPPVDHRLTLRSAVFQ